MEKIATSIESAIEMVNAMLKGGDYFNGEWFEENCGEAYLDWGEADRFYQNVSCKYFAEEAARHFQMKGYHVYYQLMGWGRNSRIPEYTPINIRIREKPRDTNSHFVPFE